MERFKVASIAKIPLRNTNSEIRKRTRVYITRIISPRLLIMRY